MPQSVQLDPSRLGYVPPQTAKKPTKRKLPPLIQATLPRLQGERTELAEPQPSTVKPWFAKFMEMTGDFTGGLLDPEGYAMSLEGEPSTSQGIGALTGATLGAPLMAAATPIREIGKVRDVIKRFYNAAPTDYRQLIRAYTSPAADHNSLAAALDWLKQHPSQRQSLDTMWKEADLPTTFMAYRGSTRAPRVESVAEPKSFSTSDKVARDFAGTPLAGSPSYLQVGETSLDDVLTVGFPDEAEIIVNPATLKNARVHTLEQQQHPFESVVESLMKEKPNMASWMYSPTPEEKAWVKKVQTVVPQLAQYNPAGTHMADNVKDQLEAMLYSRQMRHKPRAPINQELTNQLYRANPLIQAVTRGRNALRPANIHTGPTVNLPSFTPEEIAKIFGVPLE